MLPDQLGHLARTACWQPYKEDELAVCIVLFTANICYETPLIDISTTAGKESARLAATHIIRFSRMTGAQLLERSQGQGLLPKGRIRRQAGPEWPATAWAEGQRENVAAQQAVASPEAARARALDCQ